MLWCAYGWITVMVCNFYWVCFLLSLCYQMSIKIECFCCVFCDNTKRTQGNWSLASYVWQAKKLIPCRYILCVEISWPEGCVCGCDALVGWMIPKRRRGIDPVRLCLANEGIDPLPIYPICALNGCDAFWLRCVEWLHCGCDAFKWFALWLRRVEYCSSYSKL